MSGSAGESKMPGGTLIVIPAYNEEASIGGVIDSILAETPYRDVLVVNDGSTDGTRRIAEERGVAVLNLPYNLGIGAAVQTGYRYAARRGYDRVVRMDADGQHEAGRIPELLAPLAAGEADMTVGSRVLFEAPYQGSLPRAVGIKILSAIVSRLVGQRITDTTSGFRATNRAVTELFARDYPEDYPEVESIVMLIRNGFRVKEVGVRMGRRSAGRSSITAVGSIYYMIKVTLAVLMEMLRKRGAYRPPAGKGEGRK
jgi:glycosyltransferase involved in cell wall biosynthesis